MQILYSSSSESAVDLLVEKINTITDADQDVLWLLSGGSAIEIAVKSASQVSAAERITISLIDERYGNVGHPDSNWQQLIEAGYMFERFTTIPVLQGYPIEQTVDHFSDALQSNKTIVGLFGMGVDSHTSGILPNSLAAYEQTALVMAYQGPDHMRITTTPAFLSKIDHAIVYVSGKQKHAPLRKFISDNDDPVSHPVQFLKTCKSLTVVTDMENPS